MIPVPFGARTMFVQPFVMGGTTPSGIVIEHHAKLHVVYSRVTVIHPTVRFCRVGDWVIHLPFRPVRLPYRGGLVFSLREQDVLGIVEPGDGWPWFLDVNASTQELSLVR